MRHYPSQLLFLSEVLEADGFQTNPQTAYNSSSRHNGMEQRFPSPSERLQSLYAHTCVRLSGQEAVLLWGHNQCESRVENQHGQGSGDTPEDMQKQARCGTDDGSCLNVR